MANNKAWRGVYRDDFKNTAVIERIEIAPYFGARKAPAWRLVAFDSEHNVYHVSVHETFGDAREKLNDKFSCGTFAAVIESPACGDADISDATRKTPSAFEKWACRFENNIFAVGVCR